MTTGVDHITLAVSDLQRAIEFCVGVVGCTKAATWARGAYLRLLHESPHQGLELHRDAVQ